MSEQDRQQQQQNAQPLGLPAPSDVTQEATNLNIKLDHLGPVIVNTDGTISRIQGWENMTEIEKSRSLRLLAKRNNARLAALKNAHQ